MCCESKISGLDALVAFCESVGAKRASEWPPTEETLAQEFVEHFNLHGMASLNELKEFCASSAIILRIESLSKSLWGYNRRYQDKREILISETQLLTKEHTLLHELRELIEYEFRDLGMPICTHADREERAERFAFSVRMHAFGRHIPGLMDCLDSIESTWRRRVAHVLSFLFIMVYLAGLLLSPRLEEIMEQRRGRQPRLRG